MRITFSKNLTNTYQADRNTCITASAPGKVFLAGEWAILEPGSLALVMALKQRIYAQIKEDSHYSILSSYGEFRNYTSLGELLDALPYDLRFVRTVLMNNQKLLRRIKPFELKIWGSGFEHEHEGRSFKLGVGSSAAATAACMGAVLTYLGKLNLSEELLFRLVSPVYAHAQGVVGSGADLAATIVEGLISYKFSGSHKQLQVEQLSWPTRWRLLLGWSGDVASTSKLITGFKKWSSNEPAHYMDFVIAVRSCVNAAKHALQSEDLVEFGRALEQNQLLLERLSSSSGISIVTSTHRQLIKLAKAEGGYAKISGAGGGDCVVAISDEEGCARIAKAWRDKKFVGFVVEFEDNARANLLARATNINASADSP